jgi:putative ABC transport system ATP-binding protein
MALIELRDLKKTYARGSASEVRALAGVTLDIEEGDFVAIMGASGSGKSTLMNVIGCLDRPDSGSYRLDGQAVQDLPGNELARVRNRSIGFVFQQFNLLPRTSALENVELPMIYAGVPAAERHLRALECLAQVSLADRHTHTPAQLSGGQQQRVAIARALVNRPRMILADEPTGALDTRTSDDVMRLLSTLNKVGITIVLVTHEPDVAEWARRRIGFRDGHLESDLRQPGRDAPEPAAP